MTRWMTVSIDAAKIAGDAAQQHAQEQAERHRDQADHQRDLRGEHQARPEVAAVDVGAEEEERLFGRRTLHAEQVDVRLG